MFQDNVVCLSKQQAHVLGGIGQICVVNKVSQEPVIRHPISVFFWKKYF